MSKDTTPLSDKDYSQILELPLDTIVNPELEEIYQVNLAEALSLSSVMTNSAIAENVIEHLRATKKVYSRELVDLATNWNESFAMPGMMDAIRELALMNITSVVAKTSGRSFSRVREFQLAAAAQAIGFAYMASMH